VSENPFWQFSAPKPPRSGEKELVELVDVSLKLSGAPTSVSVVEKSAPGGLVAEMLGLSVNALGEATTHIPEYPLPKST
jgi:hypothetical protein